MDLFLNLYELNNKVLVYRAVNIIFVFLNTFYEGLAQ